MTPVRYEVGNFFPGLFLYSFQKPKHLFKKERAVEAARSTVHDVVASTSTFVRFSPKDSARKTAFFAYVISRTRSADQQKQLQNDAFYVQTSQCAKH